MILSNTPLFAETSLIREIGKNKPNVYIITSGSSANELAGILRSLILRHPDNKHKDSEVTVISLAEAENLVKGDKRFDKASLIFLLVRNEMVSELSRSLEARLPFKIPPLSTRLSVVVSQFFNPKAGDLTLISAMVAPDAERLGKLYDRFTAHKADNFRNLPFTASARTVKLALFSHPDDRQIVENWGGDQ
ncbi:MAG: hypothetical protein WCO51_06130 [bacterium]